MSQVGRGAWLDTTLRDCKREAVGDSIFSNNPCEMVSLMQMQIGLLQLGEQIVFSGLLVVLEVRPVSFSQCPEFVL